DQILLIEPSPAPGIDFGYRIYNGGSGDEVEHCGNGARCFVRYAVDHGLTDQRTLRVQTVNNLLELHLQDDGRVRVDMNRPLFDPAALPFDATGIVPRDAGGMDLWPLDLGANLQLRAVEVALVSMGNPHAVQFVADAERAPVDAQGPLIERHARFPRQVNAGFAQITDRGSMRLRVHERGAGETLACGTGACAAVVAGIRLGRLDPQVDVDTHGGRLTIAWAGGDAHVYMTGPAESVFEGEIDL
ncbi:MAG: diaminopimelate epimerase, partial [Burkholderiaceae bacterium]